MSRRVDIRWAINDNGELVPGCYSFVVGPAVPVGDELDHIRHIAKEYFRSHWSRHWRDWGDVDGIPDEVWEEHGLERLRPEPGIAVFHVDYSETLG